MTHIPWVKQCVKVHTKWCVKMHGMHPEKYWGVLSSAAGHWSLKKCQVGKWIRKFKKKNRRMTKKKELHPPAGIFASCGFSWGTQKVWKARLGWSKLAGCVSPDLCSWQTLDPCSWPLGKLYTYRSIHPHHLNETIMQLDSLKSFKIVENSKYWAGHYSLL